MFLSKTYEQQEPDSLRILDLAKLRFTPLKLVTVPRLGLTDTLVATKVSAYLKKKLEYKVKKRVMWLDSNPADFASCGLSVNKSKWWNDPAFLWRFLITEEHEMISEPSLHEPEVKKVTT